MPLAMQVKVLRVLQEREVIRIGSNEPLELDLRLVCATNKDLLAECNAGRFRNDLYYRINVVELVMPPLRERDDDVVLLFDYFARQAAATYNRPEAVLNSADIGLLLNHPWPGNVRELKISLNAMSCLLWRLSKDWPMPCNSPVQSRRRGMSRFLSSFIIMKKCSLNRL